MRWFPELVCLDLPCLVTVEPSVRSEALDRALRRLGVDQQASEYATAAASVPVWPGPAARAAFRSVFGGDAQADAAAAAYDDAFGPCAARAGAGLRPGAVDLVSHLRARGARVCVTTEFSAASREALLDVLVWPELVAALVSADPGDADGVVTTALGRLGVRPGETAVLAGSVSGVQAGMAAGAARIVGVEGVDAGRAQLLAAGAGHVARLDDLAEQTRPASLSVA